MDPLLDLILTLSLSLLPALMFLGLWHGLMYLRDDDLVEEARRLEAERASYPSPTGAEGSSGPYLPATADAQVACRNCGTRNAAGMTYCWNCLESLPKE